jgi:peptide/nickel transport system substrate-binding protein
MSERIDGTRLMGVLLDDWSRRKFLKTFGSAVAATSLFGGMVEFLEACASGAKTTVSNNPVKGGHLTEAVPSDPVTLNGIIDNGLSSLCFQNMFDALLGGDAKGIPYPLMTKSMPTLSSDNLTYTFNLRNDMKWTDGLPVTSDDVVFTYKLAYDPDYKAVRSPYRGQLSKVLQSATAPDPYTVVMKLSSVSASFLANFAMRLPILPKHTLGSLAPAQINNAPFNDAPQPSFGPFKFGEWKKGDHVTLTRNDACYRGAPYLDTWVWKTVPDTNNYLNSLKTGGVDVGRFFSWGLLNDIQSSGNLETDIIANASGTRWLFNEDPSKPGGNIFSDKAVRQALGHAVDRKGMVAAVYFGKGAIPAISDLPPISWAFNPDAKPQYDFDLKKAGQLLDDAGWKVGPSGVREKNGVQMKFDILAPVESPEWTGTAQIIQQSLKQINVNATAQIIPFNNLLSRVSTTRDFSTSIYRSFTQFPDPDPSQMYHSTNTAVGGLNGGAYKNPQADALMDQANATLDQNKRKQLYFQLQNVLNEDVPSIPVNVWNSLWVRNKRVQNFSVASGYLGPWTFGIVRSHINKVWVSDGK